MEIVRRVRSMKKISRQARARGLRIGFVPTMGYLHEGHLALIRKMNEMADTVVVSIFVNPTQFGPEEDLQRYPRDLTRDADLCIAEGVDYLFTPGAAEIYPPGPSTWIEVADLSEGLEGARRPGHFRGVTTVVLKLLNVVQPHVMALGQKDAQQAVIVRRLVEDLLLDLEIVVVPTVRDEQGLALSSRNAYLSNEQRRAALAIPRALEASQLALTAEGATPQTVLAAAREVLEAEPGVNVEYVELVDPRTFEAVSELGEEQWLVVAARCGTTRLIDNQPLLRE